jgi:hypothetical protein
VSTLVRTLQVRVEADGQFDLVEVDEGAVNASPKADDAGGSAIRIEYRRETFTAVSLMADLGRLGAQGWWLCTLLPDGQRFVGVFARHARRR